MFSAAKVCLLLAVGLAVEAAGETVVRGWLESGWALWRAIADASAGAGTGDSAQPVQPMPLFTGRRRSPPQPYIRRPYRRVPSMNQMQYQHQYQNSYKNTLSQALIAQQQAQMQADIKGS
ncbi:hypothetical protein GE061_006267 [Apolygus lucorum]|uniref:Uncharacterized protein n=1 Tax=Apolygus lucorum TaxID=248454 RepID=A0A8S9WUT2_APOLU|nr:hypothetical protein GE061_006267 [Apolygus lucorum]